MGDYFRSGKAAGCTTRQGRMESWKQANQGEEMGSLVALQLGDAVGDVAVIDIHCVDLAEAIEGLF